MFLKIAYKVRKRIVFEFLKRIKKAKHFLLNESISRKKHGLYNENKALNEIFTKVHEFYSVNLEQKKSEINDANRILNGERNLIYFNNNITITDWNYDYESEHEYPAQYYGDIKYIINDKKTDVKNVWELSRLHHLVIIAKAYSLTSNEKYYIYFKEQIESWLRSNPNGRSVNWTCNMEVSIRVVNIIIGYNLIHDALIKDESFMIKLKAMIYYHNKHIVDNLENYSDKRNNHYLSNLMGLLISSKFLERKNIKKYKKYQHFAKQELENEIDKQIYSDGVTYEISTSYQKLVFEIILLSLILGQSEGNQFEKKYVEILHKMHTFLNSIANKDGSIPLFGDNDSGNILVFEDYFNEKRSNLSSVIGLSECYLNPSSKSNCALSAYLNLKSENNFNVEKVRYAYQDSGYYILESNIFKMILLCGPLSMEGQGGHSHNDQLSFILNVEGIPVFIDPGTITYTGNSELRNHSRSTHSHNTVQIEEEEQNLIGCDLFAMKERTFSQCTEYSKSEFVGSHKGFFESFNCFHERKVKISEDKVVVVDSLLAGKKTLNLVGKINLILSKEVKVYEDDGLLAFKFSAYILITNLNYKKSIIRDISVSDRYGHYYTTKRITHEFLGIHKLVMRLK